ncbi:putative tRNA (adenine(37)-N6)-methyltransferase [compost metagenome]|jgi:tRNA-Thr(GGU) m(6)t(6)A37 methyltransferase TsaA
MKLFEVNSIGKVKVGEEGTFIELDKQYIKGLKALEGFSHIDVIWWFSDFDNKEARATIETQKPYKKSPDIMGVFSTRSPLRPNPIALTVVSILSIDYEKGIIRIPYIDAYDETPVIDIKPYTPSLDRVESPEVPKWCSHWPKSLEESAYFNWEDEFNFK